MTKPKKGILAKLSNLLGSIQNKVVLDADQNEVDFYELDDTDVIEVGAKATIDGADADGEVVMATGETYVFSAGSLTEIKPVEDNPDAKEGDDTIDALKARIVELEGQNAVVAAKAEKLSVKLKEQKSIIAKFQDLESELIDDEPGDRPARTKNAATPKATKLDEAVNNLKNLKLK